ncbi:glycoside hydrolase family 2 protein [Glycomyces arizonensis]|uniref:glycoside hydrolase family 2 protein n=1 Tax=Glycomyces arizonensis TaxID=256035 RepID=UPI00042146E7|nr:beta-mannosidase [Glycomyces arizonensis]
MTHLPPTFRALDQGWTLSAAHLPDTAPNEVATALTEGISAAVPGEAHLDLRRAGLIADPFDGDNEAAQQWIGDTSWRYSTTFVWSDDGSDRYDLVAFGLDTVAVVELNGTEVARCENMHRSYRWDVRELLREGPNTLAITFASPVTETVARAARDGALPRVNHHEYNQIRKMACSFGWDWGIDVAGAGIWKPIGIDYWSGVRIAAVRPLVSVTERIGGGHDGELTVHVDIERADVDVDVPVSIDVTGPDRSSYEAAGTVRAGQSSIAISVKVPDVQRWWPIDYGFQPLYDVAVTATTEESASPWNGRVGFRTIELDTSADEHGSCFVLKVNGERVLVRGANWIPDHAFLTEIGRDRYTRRVNDALEANVNLIRVWGGGIYESDDLYDLADEAGLLVWQDFLFACAAYSEDEPLRSEVEAEVRENVTRLSPHPSLVLWNGNNENHAAWVGWGWAGRLDGRPWGDAYYSDLLPRLAAELDGTRPYTPSSPFSFGDYRDPDDKRYGSAHIWDVWNNEDYTIYGKHKARFVAEFGFQGPPAWSTLAGVVHDEPLDPFGPQMLVHQKAHLGNAKLERGWKSHLPDPRSIEDWHWTTQLNQAHAIRFGVEHFRSLTPLNTGTILWQLNDNWPVVSWAAVDFNGHRKPLWHTLRDAYAPRLATFQPRASDAARANTWEGAEPEPDHLALVVVNDTGEDYTGTFALTREAFDGSVIAKALVEVRVAAREAATISVPEEIAAFGDAQAELIAAAAEDGTFATALHYGAEVVDQRLEARPLHVETEAAEGGCVLHLTAHSLARDVFCHADIADPAASADTGMITLRAGQRARIRITSPAGADPAAFAAALRCANDLL